MVSFKYDERFFGSTKLPESLFRTRKPVGAFFFIKLVPGQISLITYDYCTKVRVLPFRQVIG